MLTSLGNDKGLLSQMPLLRRRLDFQFIASHALLRSLIQPAQDWCLTTVQ